MKKLFQFFTFIISNFYFLYAQPTIEWQKSLGGTESEAANSIQQTNDGGYIVAGLSYSNNNDVTGNHGDSDYWIVKLDSTGIVMWQKSLGGTKEDIANSIIQTIDGGFIVAGWTDSNDSDITLNRGHNDCWVVKLNSTGIIEWQKTLGGTNSDRATSIQQTSNGGYIVAGWTGSSDGDVTGYLGDEDYWIVKLDSTGVIVWQKSLGGNSIDEANSIIQTNDGGFVVAGWTGSNVTGHPGSFDCWIVKLDSTGNIKWQKPLGGTFPDYANSIQQTIDGGYVIAGNSSSSDGDANVNHGWSDYWIVKLGSLVNVNEIQNSILDFQISPNPFSTETIFSFRLSTTEHVRITIQDIEGREIKNIGTNNFSVGTNKLSWNATNYAGSKVDAGIYFITIISDNFSETKKVILIRN